MEQDSRLTPPERKNNRLARLLLITLVISTLLYPTVEDFKWFGGQSTIAILSRLFPTHKTCVEIKAGGKVACGLALGPGVDNCQACQPSPGDPRALNCSPNQNFLALAVGPS